MRQRNKAVFIALLLLTGCSLAPDYHRPAVDVGAGYKEDDVWQPAGSKVPPTGKWWEIFGDATLNALQDRIDSDNPSLAAAAARYAEAAAIAGRSRADLLPWVSAGGSVERSTVSKSRPLTTGEAVTYNNYSVGPSLTYELDLFGSIRNSVRASDASADAAKSDYDAVRLGLQAQLATVYFDLRGLDTRLTLLRQTVAAYQRAYDLTTARHDGGIASEIDVSRALNLLASAKVELDQVTALRANDEHAIAILLGMVPSRFSLAPSDAALLPPRIPVDVPSALLERRPDIAAAEHRVASANAQIGVARAAFFPRIILGLTGGYQSTASNLFASDNRYWSIGPAAAALPLFDNGANSANLDRSHAEYDLAVANYRQTVLTAFREVEDDLATARHLTDQESHQHTAADAANRASDLALTRYHDGAASYLEVVTAQTAALDAQRSLLDLHSQQLKLATDLVRALGGYYDAKQPGKGT